MQRFDTASLTDRMLGAARLDEATYEAVERDESATTQALIVVVLAAIAGGIGGLGDGGRGLIVGVLSSLAGWVILSALAYLVGTTILKTAATSATLGQLLRTLGFAQTPLLLTIFDIIPWIGWILALIGVLWNLVASVIAVRHALDFSTGRAIGTMIAAFIAWAIISAILGVIFGIGAAVF